MPVAKELIQELLGKRVRLDTMDFHHVVGTLEARRSGLLVLRVQGREVSVPAVAVASLAAVGPHETDYLK